MGKLNGYHVKSAITWNTPFQNVIGLVKWSKQVEGNSIQEYPIIHIPSLSPLTSTTWIHILITDNFAENLHVFCLY